ncbi:unnamed protein product, partial [Durusdinium trenchii]
EHQNPRGGRREERREGREGRREGQRLGAPHDPHLRQQRGEHRCGSGRGGIRRG